MTHRSRPGLLVVLLSMSLVALERTATAQIGFPPGSIAPPGGTVPFDDARLNMTMLNKDAERDLSPLQNPTLNVSKLDLKAPKKARREYDQGVQRMGRKDYQSAAEHLTAAIALYPDFVAAHNALGSSYLSAGENKQARDEFAKAVALDDHLPISHLNLGCAELALQHYAAAEAAVQRGAAIAPLDLQAQMALAYAQLMNHNYAAAIATAHQVHGHPHKDAALVHYYAAAAWDSQSNLAEATQELQKLVREDPKSAAAQQARETLARLKQQPAGTLTAPPAETAVFSEPVFTQVSSGDVQLKPGELPLQARKALQEIKQKQQIAEAEAMCPGCEAANSPDAADDATDSASSPVASTGPGKAGWTLRTTVDEVAVFFAATDHGKSVPDLTRAEVGIRDDRKPPQAITGFLNESQLPLRLGLVIDTSESITGRLGFEQAAATNFLQKVLTDNNDLAFVVGFSNSVLLVQDFTADQNQISHGITELTAAGGTALWDAVGYAASKLASRLETRPVARILVVISDGEDNSSRETLKQAIETAVRGEVTIYTVSTRDNRDMTTAFDRASMMVGERALKVLAESTGGSAFFPGSLGYLKHDLAELQQVIRGRYLVSYKPAEFKRDGQYHAIDITASKSGRKLRVYARRGYYAQVFSPSSSAPTQ